MVGGTTGATGRGHVSTLGARPVAPESPLGAVGKGSMRVAAPNSSETVRGRGSEDWPRVMAVRPGRRDGS